jgi:hypothetical protein
MSSARSLVAVDQNVLSHQTSNDMHTTEASRMAFRLLRIISTPAKKMSIVLRTVPSQHH